MAKTENWQVANEGLNKRLDDLERHLTSSIKSSESMIAKRINLSEAHWDKNFVDLTKRFDDQVVLLQDIQKSVQGLQVKAATWGGGAAASRPERLHREMLVYGISTLSLDEAPLWGIRGIAQLVERRSPKPQAEGSNPSAPARFKE
jgi:hypothetical protein